MEEANLDSRPSLLQTIFRQAQFLAKGIVAEATDPKRKWRMAENGGPTRN